MGAAQSAPLSPVRRKCIRRQASHCHLHSHSPIATAGSSSAAEQRSHPEASVCRSAPSAPLSARTAPALEQQPIPPGFPRCPSAGVTHGGTEQLLSEVLLPKKALLPVKVIHTDCNCQSVIKGKARSASLKATMQTNKDLLFPALWVRPAGTTQTLALLGERSDSAPAHGTSRSLCRGPGIAGTWLCPPYTPSSGSPTHSGSL